MSLDYLCDSQRMYHVICANKVVHSAYYRDVQHPDELAENEIMLCGMVWDHQGISQDELVGWKQ